MIDEREDDKQTEVVAEKSRKAAYIYLALSVLGVAVAAAGVILMATTKFEDRSFNGHELILCLLALGAVMLFTFGGLFIRQLFRPYALITLQDGKLKLPDGTVCNPNEITSVEKSKEFGKCGKISVILNGVKIEINGVANYEKAYRKLCVLTGNPA